MGAPSSRHGPAADVRCRQERLRSRLSWKGTPMDAKPSTPGLSMITRVADMQWHALDDDLVVGRAHANHRPDGRLFVSIDAWHNATFDRLAEAMLAELPGPLYTVVDETDVELTANWQRAGFTIRRREWEYDVPTDPQITGLKEVPP